MDKAQSGLLTIRYTRVNALIGQLHLNFEQSYEVRVIPVGIFLLTLDTALFGWVGPEDVEGHMARVAEIFRVFPSERCTDPRQRIRPRTNGAGFRFTSELDRRWQSVGMAWILHR